jgi:hypothetical protein
MYSVTIFERYGFILIFSGTKRYAKIFSWNYVWTQTAPVRSAMLKLAIQGYTIYRICELY